jgi:PAS domain S-box-containing protein
MAHRGHLEGRLDQRVLGQGLLEALPLAVIATDPDGLVIFWNTAAERLYGWSTEEALGRPVIELTPAAGAPTAQSEEILERLAAGQSWSGQFTVRHRDGHNFVAWVTDVPVFDDDGELVAIVGISDDLAAMRAEGRERIDAERLQLALQAAQIGTWEWDQETGTVVWDSALEAMYGLPPGGFGGTFDEWVDRLHPDDRDEVIATVEETMTHGTDHVVEHRAVGADGQVRWIHGRGAVLHDADGKVTGMTGVAVDVTERREAEEVRIALLESEQALRERLGFLARASELLTSDLNYRRTLDQVAWLAVPDIADWCVVYLVEGAGQPEVVAMAHRDPEQLELVQELQRRYGVRGSDAHGLGKVLTTGEPALYTAVGDAQLAEVAQDREHLDRLLSLGVSSAAFVPLLVRGKPIGAMALATDQPGRSLGDNEFSLLQDLAARAAVAIENARLFEERSRVARVLQQSLLPPRLPQVPGVQTASRYDSAEEHGLIGGDFYDLFEATPGSWLVLVGDVSGKGTTAAATTGLARHTVRASALREHHPARLLEILNEVLLSEEDTERFCTAVCARLEQGASGFDVQLACAGHPPPVVLRADGSVEALEGPAPPVGLFGDFRLSSSELRLEPGDALVLYTDGVTEARRGETLFGTGRLLELLAGCTDLDADAIAQRIIEAVDAFQEGGRRDDVAIIVLRVTG